LRRGWADRTAGGGQPRGGCRNFPHSGAAAIMPSAWLMELGIKYQVQRLKKSVDAPCFSYAF
jgi:hypothetical protein